MTSSRRHVVRPPSARPQGCAPRQNFSKRPIFATGTRSKSNYDGIGVGFPQGGRCTTSPQPISLHHSRSYRRHHVLHVARRNRTGSVFKRIKGNTQGSITPEVDTRTCRQPDPTGTRKRQYTLVPDNYQWHNMNRKDDKRAQDYLDTLQHQFIQAIKTANKLTNAHATMEKHSAI